MKITSGRFCTRYSIAVSALSAVSTSMLYFCSIRLNTTRADLESSTISARFKATSSSPSHWDESLARRRGAYPRHRNVRFQSAADRAHPRLEATLAPESQRLVQAQGVRIALARDQLDTHDVRKTCVDLVLQALEQRATDAAALHLWVNGDSQIAQHVPERPDATAVGVNFSDQAGSGALRHQA